MVIAGWLSTDVRDWRVGVYRGPRHVYVCPLPTVVIRVPRRRPACPVCGQRGRHKMSCYGINRMYQLGVQYRDAAAFIRGHDDV